MATWLYNYLYIGDSLRILIYVCWKLQLRKPGGRNENDLSFEEQNLIKQVRDIYYLVSVKVAEKKCTPALLDCTINF